MPISKASALLAFEVYFGCRETCGVISEPNAIITQAKQTLSDISCELHRRGWVPATSGNFSMRVSPDRVVISASGKDKSKLLPDDLLEIDLSGRVLEDKKPSAETLLHLQLYRRDSNIGAVLHTHSIMATVVSMRNQSPLRFEGLELLKAFHGIETHQDHLRVPIFDNTQDMDDLANEVETHMQHQGQGFAYLIRGHGLYTWGANMAECMRHLEALEFLLEYQHTTQHRRE